jgi:hypothetical protein
MSSALDDLDPGQIGRRESTGDSSSSTEDPWQGTSVGAVYDRVQPLISNLRKLIRETRVGKSVIDEDTEIRSDLKDVHRALSVVDMVSDQYLIAVAGPQGSGKTTTMKWLYDIPDGYLPIGGVTGEKLPVMIVEHNKDLFEALAYRYEPEQGEMDKAPVSKEECLETARSPGSNDIAVELKVPPLLFESENRGFLLLPGVQRKSDMHIRLAERVLPSAATALICVNDGLLAGGSVDDEIQSVQDEMNVGETRLIYGLTKPRGGEKTKSAIQTLRDRFGVNEEERAFAVEAPSSADAKPGPMPEWSKDLREAIAQHGPVPHEQREAQLNTLRDILDDLAGSLESLRENVSRAQAKTSQAERKQVRPILNEFDKRVERQRERLDDKLEDALNDYLRPAIEELRDNIQNEGYWKKLKNLFKSRTLSKKRDFENLIRESWEKARPEGPIGTVAKGLNSTVQKTLQPNKPNLSVPRPEGDRGTDHKSPANLLMPVSTQEDAEDQSTALLLEDETIGDIRYLISHQEEVDPSDQLRKSVRAIPAVALESVRMGLAVRAESSSQIESASEKEFREAAEELKENWKETRESGKGMLKGVAAMLGADYAPDAELDILTDIAATMGGEGSAAALGPVVAAIAGGYGLTTVVKTLRQEDIHRDEVARRVFNRVSNRTRIRVLEKYDRYMEGIRERIEEQMRRRHNLGTKFRDRESIKAKTGSVEKSMRELEKSLPQRF